MHRLVGIGLISAALIVVSGFLFSTRHPANADATHASTKRVRIYSQTTSPTVVKGFSGVLRPAEPPVDREANILRLLASGEMLRAQTAISEWFTAEPATARDWLEKQPSWANYQPAISQIARDLAESGDPVGALEWASFLDSERDREETTFGIYATGRRYNWLSDDQIRTAPLSSKKIEDILSGAADD